MTDDGRRDRARKDTEAKRRRDRRAASATKCTTWYYKMPMLSSSKNSPVGKYGQCLNAKYTGVFESHTNWNYLVVDMTTLRISATQSHKLHTQVKGSKIMPLGAISDCGHGKMSSTPHFTYGVKGKRTSACHPGTQSVSKAECAKLYTTPLKTGHWNHVPPGCSVQGAAGAYRSAHFNTKPTGIDYGAYFTPVCTDVKWFAGGTAIIDLRQTPFGVSLPNLKAGQTLDMECAAPLRTSNGACQIGPWEAKGWNVKMSVQCYFNGQYCRMRCSGASGECYLKAGYLQLKYLSAGSGFQYIRGVCGMNGKTCFSACPSAKPVPCCSAFCAERGFKSFWPVETSDWNCCNTKRLCCAKISLKEASNANCNVEGFYSFSVDEAARAGSCDARPYCSRLFAQTTTTATTTTTDTTVTKTTQPPWTKPTFKTRTVTKATLPTKTRPPLTVATRTTVQTTTRIKTTATRPVATTKATARPTVTTRPTKPVSSAGVGQTPSGEKCTCNCKVCDAPPVYKAKGGSGTGLLVSTRELDATACKRACAINLECKSLSFTAEARNEGRRSKFAFWRKPRIDVSFLKQPDNCKLWRTKSSQRQGRQAQGELAATNFDKEELPSPPSARDTRYNPLSRNTNQHHGGATLLWLAAPMAECQRACSTTVKCQGISYYDGVYDALNCRLVGDTMVRGPWTLVPNFSTPCNSAVTLVILRVLLNGTAWLPAGSARCVAAVAVSCRIKN